MTTSFWLRPLAGGLSLALVAIAGRADAQSGLFLYAPTGTTASTFTTNAGATPTATGSISGGASNSAFMSLIRGDQAFAYQTYTGGTDSLQVMNTATQTVVQTVATGNVNPEGMVLSPNGSTLYVANNGAGANSVSVYSVNTTTGMLTQTGTIGVGTQPRALAVSPDGSTLYTINQFGNNVSVVNLATNTVTATIAVATQPASVAINPAGTRLYVGSVTGNTLTVINTATNTTVTTVGVGGTPVSIAVSPNGQYFYVAAQSVNQVRVFDAATNTQIGTFASASSPTGFVISPDGSTLYVMNSGSSNAQAFSIDASTGLLTSLGFFATGAGPALAGMCGTGSSANGLLASGGTFLATSNGALNCAGTSATLTGGTILVGANNLTMNTPIVLGSLGGTVNTNGNNMTLGGVITGTGNFTKTGLGTLTMTGNSTYSGATFVSQGTLQAGAVNAFSANSAYTVSTGAILDLNGFNQTISSLAGGGNVTLGAGTLTTGGDNTSTTFSGAISGTGGLTKNGTGTFTLSGTNTFTGGTILNAGGLTVSGSLASGVTNNGGSLLVSGSVTGNVLQSSGSTSLTGSIVGGFTLNGGTAALNGPVTGTVTASGGTLSGTGTFGSLTASGATLAPGNSIGTLNVSGNFAQSGGVYQVEVNNAGQSDKINVGGTATIGGGSTVSVQAQSGNYARNTTYTILTANGGVSGTYANVTSNFAFLTPSLAYDANNVYLSLFQPQSAFAAGAQTANQYAVGTVLDQVNASATGDFLTVMNALAVLSTAQGPTALNQISGQPYADFGTVNVQGSTLFMNAVGQQMALARGGSGTGQRQALAEACDGDACQMTPSPWSAWVSGLGGFGNVLGNGNSQTLTYNFIGTAAGIDYRVTPNILLGIAAGYTYGQQWVDSFFGKGWSNTLNVTAYGSFTPMGAMSGFYADALAGYAYSNNQLQRQLFIPGLQPRTANGSTGANQFLGQVETGYKIPVFAPAATTVTPFARLQLASVNQAAFSEWGANSLSLNVAQQTTNSVRTTFGADLAASFGLANQRTLDMGVRVGWLHEYADTGRSMTAAFAGAPANGFTVYGATPQRDSAVIGLRASSFVADATQLYFRYDGELGGGSDNHVFNVGVRLSF